MTDGIKELFKRIRRITLIRTKEFISKEQKISDTNLKSDSQANSQIITDEEQEII